MKYYSYRACSTTPVFLTTFSALGESREKGYLGSAKRKTPPLQREQECQLKQCNSKASDN